MKTLRIFGLDGSRVFAEKVADFLDIPLSKHVEKCFDDHEPYLRSEVNVRGCDVYVIQSLYTDDKESVSDKFAKLLFFIGSLRDASAGRITAVVPFLSFFRQDRKIESREPVHTKYTAMLLESVGCNRLLTMDVHNISAFQNAFRIQTDNLEAKKLLVQYVAKNTKDANNLVVLCPDSGGMTRAKKFRNALNNILGQKVGLAYLDKTRESSSVNAGQIAGDVEKKM